MSEGKDTIRCKACARKAIRYQDETICNCSNNKGRNVSFRGRPPVYFTRCPSGCLMAGRENSI